LRPLVLCYHAISDAWDDPLAVPPAAFEQQIRGVLERGYRPVAAAQAAAATGKLVHVTFDDAFRSISAGLSVLERLGVPATVFACPDFADGGTFDVPELAALMPQSSEHLATMGWGELRGLVERGVEVGSHTLTHPHLTALDDHELRRQLGQSRERLEGELGMPCRFLAYPFGDEDGRVRAAARSGGYAAAFALPGRQSDRDLYGIPRVGIWRADSPRRVVLKTSATGRRFLLDPLTSARERWPRLGRGGGSRPAPVES
jgi:peptidoglycan/xylan/chitin deacetylase (PgdA/CDA1 family)